MSHPTANLINLRQHYESIIAQCQSQASQAKEQLAHIDALLLNGLLQGAMQTLTAVIAPEQPALTTALELDEAGEGSQSQAKSSPSREVKATPVPKPIPQGNRIPRPLLPEYRGMKRLEAIAKALQSTPGQEVKIDSLSQTLFGNLSESDRILERKRLYTLLHQGEKRGLWKKGTSPYSYRIGNTETTEAMQSIPQAPAPQPKASAAKTKGAIAPHPESLSREKAPLSLLPAYEGMSKLEAIAQVLAAQSGHVLHQDTIFQLLYGEVSPEVLNRESKRMRASLFQGVTKGLWEKASNQPCSYLLKTVNGPQPQPAPLTQRKPVKPKNSRKAASTKTAAKPKRKQAEVVALLKKANIKV
jgi:hypothetical protein